MVKIALLGAGGRMGRTLAGLIAQRDDCVVIAGVDPGIGEENFYFPVYPTVQEMLDDCASPDVLVDFSSPQAVREALPVCADNDIPFVICTTGLDDEIQAEMQAAAQKTAVFYSANMSLGINLLAQLVRRAQSVLKGFDIEIIEKHHHNKLDAPSGTALLLADAINEEADGRYHYQYNRQPLREKRNPDEIGIHAVRGGSIVGEHEVLFCGPDEVITLAHSAASRDVFANGAIAAALYLVSQDAGMYNMQQMLGS